MDNTTLDLDSVEITLWRSGSYSCTSVSPLDEQAVSLSPGDGLLIFLTVQVLDDALDSWGLNSDNPDYMSTTTSYALAYYRRPDANQTIFFQGQSTGLVSGNYHLFRVRGGGKPGAEGTVFNSTTFTPTLQQPGTSTLVIGVQQPASTLTGANSNAWSLLKTDDAYNVYRVERAQSGQVTSSSAMFGSWVEIKPAERVRRKRFITRNIARTTQPQDHAEIDWDNPLTRDLVWVYLPTPTLNSAVRLNGYEFTPEAGTQFAGTKHGMTLHITPNGTFTVWGVDVTTFTAGVQPTALCALAMDATGLNYDASFVSGASGSFGYDGQNGNKLTFEASSSVRMVSPSAAPTEGLHVFGYNFTQSGPMAMFIDGEMVVEGTDIGYGYTIDRIGGPDGNGNANMKIPLVVLWKRQLSYAEHASFAKNPWQIFKSDSRTLFNGTPVITHKRRRVL